MENTMQIADSRQDDASIARMLFLIETPRLREFDS
jgi:hypothetical protein